MVNSMPNLKMKVCRLVMTVLAAMPFMVASAGDDNPQYDKYCAACHGSDARGIQNSGVDLVTSTFVSNATPQALVDFLAQGRPSDDPASKTGRPMPGFSWVPEGELMSIAAFLKSPNGAQ
jgi:mono/diheme cytochrome c family protein